VGGLATTAAQSKILHGWKAGPQTVALRQQLEALRDGGVVAISIPKTPYRCPPGPYERACLMTEWFAKHNPSAKVLIVDPKDSFVTDETMMLGWNRLYGFDLPDDYVKKMQDKVRIQRHGKPGMLGWVRGKDGGRVLKVDAKTMRVETEAEVIQADVVNIIPPMRAGVLASR